MSEECYLTYSTLYEKIYILHNNINNRNHFGYLFSKSTVSQTNDIDENDIPLEDQDQDDNPDANDPNSQVPNPQSQEDNSTIRLAFFGDTALLEPLGSRVVNDPNYNPLQGFFEFFNKFDLVIGNIETTIDGASVGQPNPGKGYTFSTPKESVRAFKEAGIDIFSYANNHTRDYGPESVLHTIKLLNDGGIEVFGAGANQDEAFTPLIKEIKGTKIAFLGYNSAEYAFNIAGANTPGTGSFIEYKVRDSIALAKAQSDIVIVVPHWGDEHVPVPNELEVTWANIFTNAGADIVIGGHPHVTQAMEEVNGKKVVYSVGNFMFPGMAWNPEAQKGWIAEVVIKDKIITDVILHDTIMDEHGVPSLVNSY